MGGGENRKVSWMYVLDCFNHTYAGDEITLLREENKRLRQLIKLQQTSYDEEMEWLKVQSNPS